MAILTLEVRHNPKTVLKRSVSFPDNDLSTAVGRKKISERLASLIVGIQKTQKNLRDAEELRETGD